MRVHDTRRVPAVKFLPQCAGFPNGKVPQVHIDGIAIDPQLEHYDKPLVGRTLNRVPLAALLDESQSSEAVGDHVEQRGGDGRDGLHGSNAQFHLVPDFNGGEDKRTQPYTVFRLKLQS